MQSEKEFPKSESASQFLDEVIGLMKQIVRANSSHLLLEMALDFLSQHGKMVRPKLVFRLGKIFGVKDEALVAWAAANELLHNATLVHDDLQDGDQWRRGRETTWKKYGAAQAINVGDLLMLAAPQAIFRSELAIEQKYHLANIFSVASAQIVNGQSFEPQLNRLEGENLRDDYFLCISQKTSTLFSALASGVSCLAGQTLEERQLLAELFLQVGNVFQIQDDILDLYGDKQRDVVGCDIREGKVSFLVALHWENHPEDRAHLRTILQKNRDVTTQEEVVQIIELFQRKGTLARAIQELQGLVLRTQNHEAMKLHSDLPLFVNEIVGAILRPIQHLRMIQ